MMDEIAFLEELVPIPSPSGQAGTGIGDAGEADCSPPPKGSVQASQDWNQGHSVNC